MRRVFNSAIVGILIPCLMWTSFAVRADVMTDAGAEGQELGIAVMPNVTDLPSVDSGGGSASVQGTNIPLDQLIPMGGSTITSDNATFYGDGSGVDGATLNAQDVLENESSWTGEAYRLLKSSKDRSHPDLRNDPIWGRTDSTLGSVAAGEFADCTTQNNLVSGTIPAHIPDYKICERLIKPPSCEARRQVDLQTLSKTVMTFSGNVDHTLDLAFRVKEHDTINASYYGYMTPRSYTCPAGQTNGAALNYTVGGDGGYYTLPATNCYTVAPTNEGFCGSSSTLVIIMSGEFMIWSCATYAGPAQPGDTIPGLYAKQHGGYYAETNETMHGDLPASVVFTPVNDEDISARQNLARIAVAVAWNGTVYESTVLQQPSEQNGWIMKVRFFTPSGGEQYINFRVVATMTFVDDNITLEPADCQVKSDEFCTIDWVCDDRTIRTISGIKLDSSWNSAFIPLYPGDPNNPVCYTAHSAPTCNYNIGTMDCYYDASGTLQCPQNTSTNTTDNTCTEYEDNPSCAFVRSECMEGAMTPDGKCYVLSEVYDCGYTVDAPTSTLQTTVTCDGEIRCMGTECITADGASSTDFARAAAMLQAAQFTTMDSDCTPGAGCYAFRGTGGTCKKAVGGIVNCCKSPGGISLSSYIDLLMAINKLDTALMSNPESAYYGTWNTLRTPIAETWSTIKQPFTSAWDSMFGSTDAAVSGASADTAAKSFSQTLMQTTAEWVGETFGQAAADALFTVNPTTGATELGGAIGTPIAWIMWAYMIYTIVMILINIIWPCEQKEFELAAKRDLKSCHYVGSYCANEFLGACLESREGWCCFNSPLSRIIQEQVRPQLGMSWGSASSPNCEGIPIDALDDIDWNQVDLTEWVGILSTTGHLPTASTDLDSRFSIDNMTGSGSALNDGSRMDSATRAKSQLEEVDVDNINEDVRQDLWGQ